MLFFKTFSIAALIVICAVSYAVAQDVAYPEAPLIQRHQWELGSELFYTRYEEPTVMENEGAMFGIAGAYSYHDFTVIKLEGRAAVGQVDYSSTNTGSSNDEDNFLLELRGLAGYDYVQQAWIITPYTGIAYRYLNNDSAGKITTTGHAGYERESNYFYSPIGVDVTKLFDDGWSIGGRLEYDVFWGGTQKSHLEDVSSSYNTLENDQKTGYGARAALRVAKKTESGTINLEAFINYWHINDSDISAYGSALEDYGLEPENKTKEIGGKISFIF